LTAVLANAAAALEPLVLVPPSAPLRPAPHGAVLHRLHGRSMGSSWRLVLAADARTDLVDLQVAIEARLVELVGQMSHWEPGSALSRFNRLPGGHGQLLPPDFAAVMRCALALAEQSEGAFDPAMGRAIQSWGFGAQDRFDHPGFVPPDGSAPVGVWRQLRLEGDRLLQPGGCVLDLSAIAKGHAVDAIAALLAGLGQLPVRAGRRAGGRGPEARRPALVGGDRAPAPRAHPAAPARRARRPRAGHLG
jgi:thiamine biosynthesis lipoprotein